MIVKTWKADKGWIERVPNINDLVEIGDHTYTVLSYFQAKDAEKFGLALAITSCEEAPVISLEFRIQS